MKVLNNLDLNEHKLENTTVLITEGGTGANTASNARENLGIVTCTQQEYNSTSDKTNKIFFIVG